MLKSVVSDLETVPEAVRAFYVEQDGRHVLAVEPVDGFALENVAGLKNALSAERRKAAEIEAARQATEASLARFGGMDPAAAQAALNRINSGEVGPDVEAAVSARVEALRAGIAEAAGTEARTARSELETVRATLAKREAQLHRVTRDNLISAELSRTKPLADAVDALQIMAEQHIRLVDVDGELIARVVDRKGEPRLDATGKPMSVRAFMAELRDQRPGLYQAPDVKGIGVSAGRQEAGSGATGHGGSENPFSRAGWNVTAQVSMTARNPALAAKLKAEAA